jgi:AhpD family alkylhydroperoxidase
MQWHSRWRRDDTPAHPALPKHRSDRNHPSEQHRQIATAARKEWRRRKECIIWKGNFPMSDSQCIPLASPEFSRRRRDLTPNQQAAFDAFGKAVFADGALSSKMKQIVAVAVAHVTQCPYCIKGHTNVALRAGATSEELMEAIWVASEMRAGGAYAHSNLMLATLAEEEKK